MNKISKNLPVGRNTRRKIKKGSSTPKTSKNRCTSRFVDVKIRMSAELYARGLPYFDELKYLPKYLIDAYTERVNRAESNNKAARLRILMGNMDLLQPILEEMAKCGKLNFLKEIING